MKNGLSIERRIVLMIVVTMTMTVMELAVIYITVQIAYIDS
jgi:hypothetical protein